MTIAPSEIIYQLMLDLELGTYPTIEEAWPLFNAFLPDERDQAITLYDTAGATDGRLMRTGEKIMHPGIQVRITDIEYRSGYRKALEIARAFDAISRSIVTLSTDEEGIYIVENVSRTGDILPLGMEQMGQRRRFHFAVNATITFLPIEEMSLFLLADSGEPVFTVAGGIPFLVVDET